VNTPSRPLQSTGNDLALSADGRVARRQLNRERVVDAYVQLLREGVINPTADDVGQRAHVTSRSVYRHLHEDPTLKSDVVHRILAPLRTMPSIDDFDQSQLADRIDAFVSFRLDLYNRAAPIMRTLRQDLGWDPAVVLAMDASRVALKQHLMTVFARDLDQLPRPQRADIFAVHTLLLFESLDHLHEHLAPDEASMVLSRQLHAVLTPERDNAFFVAN